MSTQTLEEELAGVDPKFRSCVEEIVRHVDAACLSLADINSSLERLSQEAPETVLEGGRPADYRAGVEAVERDLLKISASNLLLLLASHDYNDPGFQAARTTFMEHLVAVLGAAMRLLQNTGRESTCSASDTSP